MSFDKKPKEDYAKLAVVFDDNVPVKETEEFICEECGKLLPLKEARIAVAEGSPIMQVLINCKDCTEKIAKREGYRD